MESKDFSQGSVWRNILAQAVPLTIAQFVQLLYNVIDRMYIGHLAGASTLALTGIGLTFPIVSFISAFTNLYGMGGVPLCSIARGAAEKEHAEKIMGNTLALSIITGFAVTVLGYLFKKPVLYAFGAGNATYYYANEYLKIYLLGTLFVLVGVGMNGFISSQGFAKTGMAATVIGAVLNIGLDPLFIFYFHMGVKGAAIATVISQGISAVFVMAFLLGRKPELRLKKRDLLLEFKIVKGIVALGMSGFIMSATNCLVQIVCNVTLKIYGGDLYIGIMTVLNSIREIFFLPVTGITSGAQPVISYNYGAKCYKRVRESIAFMSIIGVVYTTAAWICIMVFPEFFIKLFNNDSELIRYGIGALHIYFFGFFMMALQFSGQSTFVALGKSKEAIFFSLLRKAFIVVPLTLWLPTVGKLGVTGVFLAEPISNAIGGMASFFTMMATVYVKLPKEKEDKI